MKGPFMNLLAIRSRCRAGAALAITVLAVLLCVPAQAARGGRRSTRPRPPVTHAKPAAPKAAATTPKALPTVPGTAGMVITIDPESGAIVPPTAEQMARLSPAEQTGLMRTSEGLAEVRLPDGSVMVDLRGRFLEYSVVRLDPLGRPRLHCVNDADVLRALLATRAPAPTPAREER
jgi:hypothetical protein